jgi:hypothetical protein
MATVTVKAMCCFSQGGSGDGGVLALDRGEKLGLDVNVVKDDDGEYEKCRSLA